MERQCNLFAVPPCHRPPLFPSPRPLQGSNPPSACPHARTTHLDLRQRRIGYIYHMEGDIMTSVRSPFLHSCILLHDSLCYYPWLACARWVQRCRGLYPQPVHYCELHQSSLRSCKSSLVLCALTNTNKWTYLHNLQIHILHVYQSGRICCIIVRNEKW